MYVSPVIRSIIEDPIDGEKVALLVEVGDDYDPGGDPVETVASDIRAQGGEILDRRRFGTLVVETPHERLEDICEVDGIGIVESENVGTVDADGAGEDVEFEE